MNRSFSLSLFALILVNVAAPAPLRAQEAAKVRAALDQVGTLDFANFTLDEAADRLQTLLKVKVAVHESLRPLLESRQQMLVPSLPSSSGLPPPPAEISNTTQTEYTPGFSCQLRNLRLGAALRVFLEHYGLGYAILGDTLVIATADKADSLSRQQPIDAAFDAVRLGSAAEDLGRRYGVDIAVDAKAAREVKITRSLRDLTLEEGVHLLAESADLAAAPVGGGWLITSADRARQWQTRHDRQAAEARKQWVEFPVTLGAGILAVDPTGPMGLGGFGGLGGGLQPVASPALRAPKALLQTAGPAPRTGTETPQAKGPPLQPAAAPKNRAAADVLKKLAEPSNFGFEDPATLKDVLQAWEKQGLPHVVIRQAAFKLDNPDAPDLYETQVKLPPGAKGLPAGKVLRLILDQVPTSDATYLVHPGYIVVTTIKESLPNSQFVQGSFAGRPLDEVLQELSEMTGVTVLLDPRVGDKAKTPVTARFAAETNLAQAVRVLADMADLRAILVDTVVYVTSRGNSVAFPPEAPGPGKYVRPDLAQ